MARPLLFNLASLALLGACFSVQVNAAKPSETLLPETAKLYISIPDMDLLEKHWDQTQLGKLVADPVMKPFVEDLRRQLRGKLSQTNARLGIGWADLQGVYGGEICTALLQPWDAAAAQVRLQAVIDEAEQKAKAAGKGDEFVAAAKLAATEKIQKELERERRSQAAVLMLVDVTGHLDEARDLLATVAKNQIDKGATQGALKIGEVDVVTFTMPLKAGQKVARQAFYCIHEEQFISTDRQDVLAKILARFEQADGHALSGNKAFVATGASADKAFGNTATHVRWFIEPFGMAEVSRAYAGGRKRRGADMLRVLQRQGFKAVQGFGGKISFKTDAHDILHHSLVYAPAVERKPGDVARTKYDLAMRMLDFPNTNDLLPQAWVPRGLATHLTFNWKMKEAFWYAKTFVNEFVGDDVFDDMIANIELDPHGPQIKVKQQFTDHLDERASLITDYRLPITPKSERLLLAIQVTNPQTVMKTLNKAMENDPAAKKRVHLGHVIWEIKNEAVKPDKVDITGLDGGFGFQDPMEVAEEEDKPFISNAAVTVAHGHLMIASHVDYIMDVVKPPVPAESLRQAADYVSVSEALADLGAKNDSFQFFTRSDEAARVTYELMRNGKMPEAETLLGKMLNRMLASDEDEEDELREQQIDGAKMPEFQIVRRYLGPGGFFVTTVDDGWTISGCLLTNE